MEDSSSMFYAGDLQSGIGQALQESKLVACFVTDGGDESQLWENEFLKDNTIKSFLSQQTILLRLIAGSQEAGYLAAIFPLPKTPTVVLIENGQLKEYITAGVTKQEFLRRIQVVFQSRVDIQPQQASSETTDNSLNPSSQSPRLVPGDETPVSPAVASSSHVAQGSSESGIPDQTRDREREAVEKAKRVAESNAKKSAVEKKPSATTPSTADMKYALMQKKRQQEARDERARILKRVEADKVERRKRETERRAGASAKESQGTGQSTSIKSTSTSTPTQGQSKECALQIRLFDGSTIRKRFSTQGTLRADVRPWIDQQQTIDTPYTFKHVLTPQPNKNISISDEEKTLLSQGLAPTATLILVSVQSYTSAYDDAGATGFVSRGISAGYGVVSSGVGLVTGVLGSLLGGRAAPDPALSDNATPSSNQTSNINVRTLRDQDRREDHQFYNGNALNFEPRKDDEDKKDE